ncbi:hypothetical protein [Agromyces flavus]|uniref:hypothetical protein n=1 Tax=Agromyces flavus TaxID=589382 RepID=UPI0012F8D85A|nr:hypothetical protein [Agromyces flavus]GGI46718.1 hypothetical protein GCM10010932_16020 [Agromyces flavus]
MVVTTPLRKPAPAPSEFDEAESHEPGDARLRDTASARSVIDESARREPVEVLIKEARNRARRRRGAYLIAASALAISAGAFAMFAGSSLDPDQ